MFPRPASPSFASLVLDPIPFVRGLTQLIPLRALGGHLDTDMSRLGTPPEPARRGRHLARDCHDPLRRRLDPQGLAPPPSTLDDPEPTDGAFTQARQRLASLPYANCSWRPLAPWPPTRPSDPPTAAGDSWASTAPCSTSPIPRQRPAFGRPTTGLPEGAFPQVRLLALCELGTHAACGLAIKPICHGEPSMVGGCSTSSDRACS